MSVLSLKALSIRQPWAHWILHARKDVENRSWLPFDVCGPLLVHASKTWASRVPGSQAQAHMVGSVRVAGVLIDAPINPPRGALVGIIRVWMCEQHSVSPWAEPGMWHWHLCDPLAFSEPVPWRGRQRFFNVPIDELPEGTREELRGWLGELPQSVREEFDAWLSERGDSDGD